MGGVMVVNMKRQEWMTLNLLLIPLYSVAIMMLFGNASQTGAIQWPVAAATILLCPVGAWLLSRGKNLRSRLGGLLCYCGLGVYQAVYQFIHLGPKATSSFDFYMGLAVVAMGLVVFYMRRQYK